MMTNEELYEAVIKRFGITSQTMMLAEETGELLQVASKLARLDRPADMVVLEKLLENLSEEIADVQIVIDQLKFHYHIADDRINWWRAYKIKRLEDRLKEADEKLGKS